MDRDLGAWVLCLGLCSVSAAHALDPASFHRILTSCALESRDATVRKQVAQLKEAKFFANSTYPWVGMLTATYSPYYVPLLTGAKLHELVRHVTHSMGEKGTGLPAEALIEARFFKDCLLPKLKDVVEDTRPEKQKGALKVTRRPEGVVSLQLPTARTRITPASQPVRDKAEAVARGLMAKRYPEGTFIHCSFTSSAVQADGSVSVLVKLFDMRSARHFAQWMGIGEVLVHVTKAGRVELTY